MDRQLKAETGLSRLASTSPCRHVSDRGGMLLACRATQGVEAAFLAAVQASMRAPHWRNAVISQHPANCSWLAMVLAASHAEFTLPPAAWSPSLLGLLCELLCALPLVSTAAALHLDGPTKHAACAAQQHEQWVPGSAINEMLTYAPLQGEESTAESWTFALQAASDAPRLAAWLLAGHGQAALLAALPVARQNEGLYSIMLFAFSDALIGLLERAEDAQREAARSPMPQSSKEQLQQDSRQVAAALQELAGNGSLDKFFARVGSACARLAGALLAHWQEQDAEHERQQAAQLELARAAATRASCAHLACSNLDATGRRGKLCSGCRVARYCSHACSMADWRAGHRAACRLLAAARAAEGPAGQPQGRS